LIGNNLEMKTILDLSRYEKIWDRVDAILGDPIYMNGALVGRGKKITTEQLEQLVLMAKEYVNPESNKGELRTVLVALKPYRNEPQVEQTWAELVTLHKS